MLGTARGWMSPGWHPWWDNAHGMVSWDKEGAMVPLILGQVWGKGKWLGGKSTFLSRFSPKGFIALFFFPPI